MNALVCHMLFQEPREHNVTVNDTLRVHSFSIIEMV